MRDAFLTLCGIGYLPAPGTWASVASLPILLGYFSLLPADSLARGIILGIVGIVISIIAVSAVAADEKARKSHDRSSVVIDEFLGMYVALLPLAFGPAQWWQGIIALIAFRIFDIAKPLGIRRIDALKTPVSVIADDLAAGLYAMAIVLLT